MCNKWSWRNESKMCFSMGFQPQRLFFSAEENHWWLMVLGYYAQTVRSFRWISPAHKKPRISNWTGVRCFQHVGLGNLLGTYLVYPFGPVLLFQFCSGIGIIMYIQNVKVLWPPLICLKFQAVFIIAIFGLEMPYGFLAPEMFFSCTVFITLCQLHRGFSRGSGPPNHYWPQNLKII